MKKGGGMEVNQVANTCLYKDGETQIVDANNKEAFDALIKYGWGDTPQPLEDKETKSDRQTDEELEAENEKLAEEQEAHDEHVINHKFILMNL